MLQVRHRCLKVRCVSLSLGDQMGPMFMAHLFLLQDYKLAKDTYVIVNKNQVNNSDAIIHIFIKLISSKVHMANSH